MMQSYTKCIEIKENVMQTQIDAKSGIKKEFDEYKSKHDKLIHDAKSTKKASDDLLKAANQMNRDHAVSNKKLISENEQLKTRIALLESQHREACKPNLVAKYTTSSYDD